MPDGEVVVLGLARVRESAHILVGLGVEECRGAPGDDLVRVALVGHVEDDLVPRGVEHAVKRDGQLDDREVGAHVAADDGGGVDDRAANLCAKGAHRLFGQGLDVRRALDLLQVHARSPSPQVVNQRRE